MTRKINFAKIIGSNSKIKNGLLVRGTLRESRQFDRTFSELRRKKKAVT